MDQSSDPVLAKAREDEQRLEEAERSGRRVSTWVRLSGPGWLQSAITLGGGSLASALYLGVLTGTEMLWLQPLAMILGVIMLGAISHVTLSTGKRPFEAIRTAVNPVLAWGWIIAVLLANLVWSLPQFALGTAALQQNLVPSLEGDGGKVICCAFLLLTAGSVIWFYDRGSSGIKVFERVLKGMVGLVVISFFGVLLKLSFTGDGLPWGEIASGLVPNPGLLSAPASRFESFLAETGEYRGFWEDLIVGEQRDVMIAAAATAVGINMTFLLPYSMLRKGWNRRFRGLALFDLGTGLLVPFVLATGCVVIAAGNQFHARHDEQLVQDLGNDPHRAAQHPSFNACMQRLDQRLAAELGADWVAEHHAGSAQKRAAVSTLPEADRALATMLLKRDAFGLAASLEPLTGRAVSQYVFGLGVLGMALSTIIILMLISGFTFCEMFGRPPTGAFHRFGCLAAGVGVLGPFVWTGDAKFWLAVPTSVFGMALLPIAYWTFFLMMNSRRLMGEQLPRGGRRLAWNALMLLAAGVVTPAALYSIWGKAGWVGLGLLAAFLGLAAVFHRRRPA